MSNRSLVIEQLGSDLSAELVSITERLPSRRRVVRSAFGGGRTQSSTSKPPVAQASRQRRGGDSYDNIEPLFEQLAQLAAQDPRRPILRENIIGRCLPLAHHIAKKYAGRGENFDDLLQIARLGLLQAVDRFDPACGAKFLAFAVPTIMGEVRHHFRDHTWAVRVPRRIKEIQQLLGPATDALTHELGRPPKAREIAEKLGIDLVEVTHALIARNAYQTAPIDAPANNENDSTSPSLLDFLGAEDPEYRHVEDFLAVRPLIAALPAQERQVLHMRFFQFRSQQQIAQQIGVSQMQVSRILSRTLNTLRESALRD
ncbi:RNA polymerase sigma factor SigF [Nocardia sp. A7]|uniref:RNA polymerase sigma factor SigF n=1 Tax=Nocardia sp. A7 TaxID=2789274 RepID=UPI00397C2586